MWNQLKGEFNLISDDAISKSSNIFLLSVFTCFWQRCNSKNWTTFITWCVWPQTGEFLDKPIHLFKDLIHLTQNQQLRQKPITKQVFGGVWHNRNLQAAPSTVALDSAGVTHMLFWLTQTVGAAVLAFTTAKWHRPSTSMSWAEERKQILVRL